MPDLDEMQPEDLAEIDEEIAKAIADGRLVLKRTVRVTFPDGRTVDRSEPLSADLVNRPDVREILRAYVLRRMRGGESLKKVEIDIPGIETLTKPDLN